MDQKPSVGRIVHYRALGSADGKFPVGECRAAIITSVSDWGNQNQGFVSLAILNPTGMYFNSSCGYMEDKEGESVVGGTWHWPERV